MKQKAEVIDGIVAAIMPQLQAASEEGILKYAPEVAGGEIKKLLDKYTVNELCNANVFWHFYVGCTAKGMRSFIAKNGSLFDVDADLLNREYAYVDTGDVAVIARYILC